MIDGTYSGLTELASSIRARILEVSGTEKGAHLGGTFSCVEILISIFESDAFNFGFQNEMHQNRDRFIFSKGHACLCFYVYLHEKSLLTLNELRMFSTDGGLGAQLDIQNPYVDWNTGSLGHSIGICAGIGISASLDSSNLKAVTLIGDSELSEGSVWEAIAFCGDRQLANVIVVIDRNRLSVTTRIDEDSVYKNLDIKMRSFGWNFAEVDGHSFFELAEVFESAVQSGKPTMILANTIKGKGVSFMENMVDWHHKRPSQEELRKALSEVNLRNSMDFND